MDSDWFWRGLYLLTIGVQVFALYHQRRTIREQGTVIDDLLDDLHTGGDLLSRQRDTIVILSEQYELLAHHCLGPSDQQNAQRSKPNICPN